MPAIGHPSLDPCPPNEQSIWRFMSVAKFVSLLSSKSLYLSSIAELRKRDPFEGTYPIPNHIDRSRIETDDAYARSEIGDISEESGYSNLRSMWGRSGGDIDQNRYCHAIYVNCWHMGDRETAFLWSASRPRRKGLRSKAPSGQLGTHSPAITTAVTLSSIRLSTSIMKNTKCHLAFKRTCFILHILSGSNLSQSE